MSDRKRLSPISAAYITGQLASFPPFTSAATLVVVVGVPPNRRGKSLNLVQGSLELVCEGKANSSLLLHYGSSQW